MLNVQYSQNLYFSFSQLDCSVTFIIMFCSWTVSTLNYNYVRFVFIRLISFEFTLYQENNVDAFRKRASIICLTLLLFLKIMVKRKYHRFHSLFNLYNFRDRQSVHLWNK